MDYTIFHKFKEQGKHLDFRFNIRGKSIYVHRVFMCELSELIQMLIRRKQTEPWPPLHELDLEIPHIATKDFEDAIDVLYGRKIPEESLVQVISVLQYLLVDAKWIARFLVDYLPALDQALTEHQKMAIAQLVNNEPASQPKSNYFQSFYGEELDGYVHAKKDEPMFHCISQHPTSYDLFHTKNLRAKLETRPTSRSGNVIWEIDYHNITHTDLKNRGEMDNIMISIRRKSGTLHLNQKATITLFLFTKLEAPMVKSIEFTWSTSSWYTYFNIDKSFAQTIRFLCRIQYSIGEHSQ